MPTGTGKSAVISLTPFLLKSNKMLVITPNSLLREQLFDELSKLTMILTIKALKLSGSDINHQKPLVKKLEKVLNTNEKWLELLNYDTVISTPKCISSYYKGVIGPPEKIFKVFDLIIFDEGHHTPSKTFNYIKDQFKKSKAIMFTATPYRLDRRPLEGKLIFNYSIKSAKEDGLYKNINILLVKKTPDSDVVLAKKTEEIYLDRTKRFNQSILIRVESLKRSKEIFEIYSQNTQLKLLQVNSSYSLTEIKDVIRKLKNGDIHGIIAINMVIEGFDFPGLKICTIHDKHKSIPVTIQFIGRITRSKLDSDLGDATVITTEEITNILYQQSADWENLLNKKSSELIGKLLKLQSFIEQFDEDNYLGFSLKHLFPKFNVTVYKILNPEYIRLSKVFQEKSIKIFDYIENNEKNLVVFITQQKVKPQWYLLDEFHSLTFDLVIIYFNIENRILFIHTTNRNKLFTQKLVEIIGNNNLEIVRKYSLQELEKILIGYKDFSCFNIGLKNHSIRNYGESYRILAGNDVQRSINPIDGSFFSKGHIMVKAKSEEHIENFGYSSSSKFWNFKSSNLDDFIESCNDISEKLNSSQEFKFSSELDFLREGKAFNLINQSVIAINWNSVTFQHRPIVKLNGENCFFIDIKFEVVTIVNSILTLKLIFNDVKIKIFYKNQYPYFTLEKNTKYDIMVGFNDEEDSLIDYLNLYPLRFFTDNLATIEGNQIYENNKIAKIRDEKFIAIDWIKDKVKITRETPNDEENSIHDYLIKKLPQNKPDSLFFYDQNSGELADFIEVSENLISDNDFLNDIKISFYCVKASKNKNSGVRVGDFYDVVGQVIKTCQYLNKDVIIKHIKDRISINKGLILEGKILSDENDQNYAELFSRLNSARNPSYEFIIVQPGLSFSKFKSDKRINVENLLNCLNSFLLSNKFEELILFISE